MTRFEKLKAKKCMEIELDINYQNALLNKWKNMSIEEMAKEYIQQLDNGEYHFTCVSDKDVNTIYHGIDMLYAELYEKDTDNV